MYTVININIKAEMWNIWKDKSYDRLKYDMFRKTRWIGINVIEKYKTRTPVLG